MADKQLILVVDDEPGIQRLIDLILSQEGFRVVAATNGFEALSIMERRRPDLVLLDLVMPEMNGLEFLRRLRERSRTPVIILTGRGEESERVEGLDAGADDYVLKPFNPSELSARVRAVLRRAHQLPGDGENLRTDGVEIDLDHRLVKKNGEVINLTRTEWRLLQELAANAGKVMLNEELLARVWGQDYRDHLPYLRVWIWRLRSKLEQTPGDPKVIESFPGIGYMLSAGEAGRRHEGHGH